MQTGGGAARVPQRGDECRSSSPQNNLCLSLRPLAAHPQESPIPHGFLTEVLWIQRRSGESPRDGAQQLPLLPPPALPACSVSPGVGCGSRAPVHSPLASVLCTGLTVPSCGPAELDGVSGCGCWRGAVGPHLQPGGHLVPSGLLCLSTWPDDLPVVGDNLGVGV